MRGLKEKVIVVAAGGTGGRRSNMGAATSIRLAQEGARVVVGDVDEEMAVRTIDAIRAEGGTAMSCQFDGGDGESVKKLIDTTISEFGQLNGLHYNAADLKTLVEGDWGDISTVSLETWNRTLQVDLTGFMFAAKYAIPHLLDQDGGAIIGTGSISSHAGFNNMVAYSAAKAGMPAVARHIATAYGSQGIRSNIVLPGSIKSTADHADEQKMRETVIDSQSGSRRADQYLFDHNGLRVRAPRVGKPEDIAAMVAFLMSDDGAYVNGQLLFVDGGQILGR